MAQASDRPVCNEVQQQYASVCITGTGPPGMDSGHTQPAMGGSGCLCLPTSSHLGQVVKKMQDQPCHRIILIAPGWPNMPWFWDLVTMSNQIPLSLPNLPNRLSQPFNQIPQKSYKPKSPRMAPRASVIKEQGFSETVEARIEALFEPIKEASLKHLMFKTVFLWALGGQMQE